MDGSKMTGRYKKMKKGKSWVIILVAVICIGFLGWGFPAGNPMIDHGSNGFLFPPGLMVRAPRIRIIRISSLVSTSQVVFQSPTISRTRILQTRT